MTGHVTKQTKNSNEKLEEFKVWDQLQQTKIR
jgi:hypothetical protein